MGFPAFDSLINVPGRIIPCGSPMSAQVYTVKRVFELFNLLPTDPAVRRASPTTDELLGLFTADVVFTQPALQPEGTQLCEGREELRESWDRWFDMWEEHRSLPQEIIEDGPRVLVLSRDHFRGREGVELEQKGGAVFTFDGPQIARFETFFDHETARRQFERPGAL